LKIAIVKAFAIEITEAAKESERFLLLFFSVPSVAGCC